MQHRTKCRLIDVAFSWHGGQSSPLYSFASTRTVHSEEHRTCVHVEIAGCIDIVCAPANVNGYTPAGIKREVKDLTQLSVMVTEAKIGDEIVTNDDITFYWMRKNS